MNQEAQPLASLGEPLTPAELVSEATAAAAAAEPGGRCVYAVLIVIRRAIQARDALLFTSDTEEQVLHPWPVQKSDGSQDREPIPFENSAIAARAATAFTAARNHPEGHEPPEPVVDASRRSIAGALSLGGHLTGVVELAAAEDGFDDRSVSALRSVLPSLSLALGLAEATLELDTSDSRFRETISKVSHDLRTPLAGILSSSELLTDYGEDSDTRKEFLGIIHEEATRLDRLVDQIVRSGRTGGDTE